MSAKRNSLYPYVVWPTLLVFLLFQRANGQNLVPNPSFEDINICSEYNQPCSPSAWFYLSKKLTTGYLPRFPSATGSRHLRIVAASRQTENRQYWETMLLCPLEAGAHYNISLKVASPRNATQLGTTCPNLRDIGLWFTTRFIFVQGDSILQPRSYLSFVGATTRDLKNGWFEIRKEFVPSANARILIVGNFYHISNVDIMDQRNNPGPTIDILVDDISVEPIKGTSCADYQKTKDSLYAIRSRHSDHHPGDMDPDVSDAPPDTTRKVILPPKQRTDTPKSPYTPLSTDTIIIHNIQFDFDKYLVQNPDTLERYQKLLTKSGIVKIQVVGYTDDVGSEAYNLDLSKKRADEVARLLIAKFNLPLALIEAEGRGISRAYPTRDLNRRVEIYIFHE